MDDFDGQYNADAFRRFIDALPTAVYMTDAEGRVTHFNQAAVELSGRVPELGTDTWCISWKLYHGDGRPMLHEDCPMAVTLKERRPVRGVEIIVERPDGQRVWCLPYPSPLRDADGRVVGGINMLFDLTARRLAENASGRLAAIVESSDDAIISKDLNGTIMSWNRGAERLFGYTAQEAVGQPVTILFPPDRLDEEPQILERIRRGEVIEHYETVRRRKDGSAVDISLTVSPVRDEHDQVIGVSKIARDITERRRAEQILRERENERRHELEHALQVEREIAETLQHSLLPPRLPRLQGVDLAARYVPASSDAAVGGDFYDVMVLPNGRLALTIGDVAGHGPQAASITGQVRMLLRAYGQEGHPPAFAVDRLNRLLRSGDMVTLLHMVLDPISGQISYVNAGHPPPLLVAPNGASRFVHGVDPPLIGGWQPLETFTAAISPGETMILYTDGLVESKESIDGGLERLADASRQAVSADIETVADAIVKNLVGTRGRRDDVALLAVRIVPLNPARFLVSLPSIAGSIHTLRLSLRRWLEAGNVAPQPMFDIVVASGEAATNAIQYAYGPDGGSFEVEALREGDKIVLWVRDEGRWRPRQMDQPGHGLAIMRRLMDAVNLERGPEGTIVRLELTLRNSAAV